MDLDQYREQSYTTWQVMARGWERNRESMWKVTRAVGESLVAKLDPQPGQTILELAAGLGDTGLAAVASIGDSGKLISTDFSPEMVEAARKHAEELGISNVEHRVLNAESMDLVDDSVDGVLCRFGYMLMADPAAAIRETRRVLRDGGRLAFSVWAGADRNPWAALAGATLVAREHLPPPEPGAPGIFAMASPDRISELVTGAGFGEPHISETTIEWQFDDLGEYWRFLNELSGGLALVIEKLPEEEQLAVRDQLGEAAAAFRDNGGLRFPGATLDVVTR